MVITVYRCVSLIATSRLSSQPLENGDTPEPLMVFCRREMVTTAALIPSLLILFVKNVVLMTQSFMMMTSASTGGAPWNSLPWLASQESF